MSASNASAPTNRVVLVTGSARGLGLATARAFQRRGDRVHVVWRTASPDTHALEREFPRRAHRSDLVYAESAVALVEAVIESDGRLDTLVHAVGDYVSGPLEKAAAHDSAHMFASNVESALRVMDAARPSLRASRGSALFFGCAGLEGLRGRRDIALYAAAKSALLVLVRSWALEEAPHGVRVNMLSPGIVPHEHAASDTLDARLHARIPMGRPGTPEEIADSALFLCSDEARYTTGVDLAVAGGWLL